MKALIKFLAASAVIAMALLAIDCFAQINATQPYRVFSAGATNGGGTLATVIIGAHSVNNGTPVVTSVNVDSDLATAKIQFYKVLRQVTCQYSVNSGAVISVNNTNGFASGDVIIIRHMTNDGYEKRTLTTMTSATNLTTTAAPYTTVPGDIVYGVTTTGAGTIPVYTNTLASPAYVVNLTGPAIYAGQKGMPLLLEVNATSSGHLNYVTATYADP